jgi:alpha-mannosidase
MRSPGPHITLVPHTHWDREWYEPSQLFRAHLIELIDQALDALSQEPRLHLTLDGHVALIDDYLALRPERTAIITALVEAGRLHIGPWLTQADTLIGDGESLIRNLLLGLRRAERLGGAMRLGYMPDRFGQAAQLPQILRLFGIEGAVLWRDVGPERPAQAFRWVAPDGSAVTVLWLQDGRGAGRRFPADAQGFAESIERHIRRLGAWLGEMPVLVPIGDDGARLAAWLPAAVERLSGRLPGAEIKVGGYQHQLPRVGAVSHTVVGELRAPSFAPVAAGAASARVRETQAAARVATRLTRYAEPLAAWLAQAAPNEEAVAARLIAQAWRLYLLNHAQDSVAGCGVDAAHEDARARYRQAEELAAAACDEVLARLHLSGDPAVAAFHPGPAAPLVVFEAHVPRALGDALEAVGADGVARPVQVLDPFDEPPRFTGEFSGAELERYLGGLAPDVPLFGKYPADIALDPERPDCWRLDITLGDLPAPPGRLAADRARVKTLLSGEARFRVRLHDAGELPPALVACGPAPEAGFIGASLRPGQGRRGGPFVEAGDDPPRLRLGTLTVVAESDGTVWIRDRALAFGAVRANDLVDEGDRGDLLFGAPVGPAIRPRAAAAQLIERGPLRGRLRIVQRIDLPVGLDLERRGRADAHLPLTLTTDVVLLVGERRVSFETHADNTVCDHRLRALAHLPLAASHLDVEHGLAVVSRPLDPRQPHTAPGRPAPVGQHHGFVDLTDGRSGVALFSPGLLEHETWDEPSGCALALTLLRAVGRLGGVAAPGAEEAGPHVFRYALLLHDGDWRAGGLVEEARRFAAPPVEVRPRGRAAVPVGRALVEIAPRWVALSALYPGEKGVVVRLVNLAPEAVEAALRPAWPVERAESVDPLERPAARPAVRHEDDVVWVKLGPWQIATVSLERRHA